MAGTSGSYSLRVLSLATFHAVSFVAAVVLGVHLRGSLPAALQRLDTARGFGAFLVLWILTWFTTRAGLDKLESRVEDAAFSTVVFSMTVAGGWNGVGIFAVVLLVGLALIVARGGSMVLILFPAAAVGGVLAFTIGCVAGMFYGFIDALLLRLGAALFRWAHAHHGSG